MNYMMYFLPAIALSGFYGYVILFLNGLSALGLLAWMYQALAYLGSFLMLRGKWWGCVPGIAVGVLLINAGLEGYSPVVSETVIGAFVFCYYTAVGYARKLRKL